MTDTAATDTAATEDSPLVDVSGGEHESRSPSPGRHRYTGPELSALLNQVRRELGTEASIVEANRVRSGGIAGFFAKESFEVVAAPSNPSPRPGPPAAASPSTPEAASTHRSRLVPTPAPADAPAVPVSAAGVPADPPAVVPVPASRVPARPVPAPTPPSPASPAAVSTTSQRRSRPPADISVALLERAEAISALERVSVGRSIDDADARFAGARNRFGHVLEAELASASRSPSEAAESPAAPVAVQAATDDEPVVVAEPADEPAATADGEALPADVVWDGEHASGAVGSPVTDRAPTPEPVDVPGGSAPIRGSLMMVIGSVGAATTVARGLIAGRHTDYAELAVVAHEPGAIDVPPDRIGRHYEAIARHLVDWTVRGDSGIVVVDATVGTRLRAEVECLRNLGADSIVVVDDRRSPAIDTLRLLDGIVPIEGTIVVSAPAAHRDGGPEAPEGIPSVRRAVARRPDDSVSGG